jgi:hypothetical protein
LKPYHEDRLLFVTDLQNYLVLHKEKAESFLTISCEDVRYSLGEINKDTKIPVIFGHFLENTIFTSLKEFATLIKYRYEDLPITKPSEEDKSSLRVSSQSERKYKLPYKTYRTSNIHEDEMIVEIIQDILEKDSAIDAAMLGYWFSKNSNGVDLIGELVKFYNRIIAEEIRVDSKEPIAYLGHIALIKLLRRFKVKITKGIRIQGISFEKLDNLFSNLFYVILKNAISTSLKVFEKKQLIYDIIKLEYLLLASISPVAFTLVEKYLLKNDYNPYHLSWDFYELLSSYYSDIPETLPSHERAEALFKKIKHEKEIFDKAYFNAKLIHFRHAVLNYFFKADNQKEKVNNYLLMMLHDSKFLEQTLIDPNETEICKNNLNMLFNKSKVDEKIKDSIAEIEDNFGMFKTGFLMTKLFLKPKDEVLTVLNNFICLHEDIKINNIINIVIDKLENLRSKISEEEILQEYEKGRIYRFATDDQDILKKLEIKKEGQLFIDLKGYTKRTYKAKEIVMADFMKKEFYIPILTSAKKYYVGVGTSTDSKDVSLNNLLGDAVAFSGTVQSLVKLAEDIQEIIKEYGKKLKRFEKENGKEGALKKDEDEDGRLNAGLFISYGRSAELIKIDDEVWGGTKVAIAEKINEAARGTARNALLKEKLNNIIKEEEKKRNKGKLSYPFSVFIDKNYSFNFNMGMTNTFELALKQKDKELAKKLSQSIAKLCYNDICSAINSRNKSKLSFLNFAYDIYNLGEALSDEAMVAYLQEVKDKKNYFKKVVKVSELRNEILDKFAFSKDTINFIVCTEKQFDSTKIDLFRCAGQVKFKGFEEKKEYTTVFEIIRKDSELYKMLMKYHMNDWMLEVKKTGYESEIDISFN